jgi:hypothetical protein
MAVNPCGNSGGSQSVVVNCGGCSGGGAGGGTGGGIGTNPQLPGTTPNPNPYPPGGGAGGEYQTGDVYIPIPGCKVKLPESKDYGSAGFEYLHYDLKTSILAAIASYIPPGKIAKSVRLKTEALCYSGVQLIVLGSLDIGSQPRDFTLTDSSQKYKIPYQVENLGVGIHVVLWFGYQGRHYSNPSIDLLLDSTVVLDGQFPDNNNFVKDDTAECPAWLNLSVCGIVCSGACDLVAGAFTFSTVADLNAFLIDPFGRVISAGSDGVPAGQFISNWSRGFWMTAGQSMTLSFPTGVGIYGSSSTINFKLGTGTSGTFTDLDPALITTVDRTGYNGDNYHQAFANVVIGPVSEDGCYSLGITNGSVTLGTHSITVGIA